MVACFRFRSFEVLLTRSLPRTLRLFAEARASFGRKKLLTTPTRITNAP
jgi:hypothetical protein